MEETTYGQQGDRATGYVGEINNARRRKKNIDGITRTKKITHPTIIQKEKLGSKKDKGSAKSINSRETSLLGGGLCYKGGQG